MKIRAVERAWYKKAIVEEGEILEYDGDTVPCWGTLTDGEDIKELNENEPSDDDNENEFDETDDEEDTVDESDVQKLELLRDLAAENNVWLDTLPDDASVTDEIKALSEASEAKGVKLNIGRV